MIKENNTDPNSKDYDSRTALHLAVEEDHNNVVKFLVKDCGVDINAKDRF